MITVTKPYFPPIEKYIRYIEQIWNNNQLTNAGPLVLELESNLREYLETTNCYFLNNGTIALQLAIKALDLQGEIITTPFSYVATTSSIVWEGCIPVFVDIEEDTLTIDPAKIEESITDRTVAILATHVYGNPCDIEKIETIAKKYNLKIIYDAAHCFGVKYKNIPIVNYGDISTLSFHATKLFHTGEGGAVISNNVDIAHKLSYMRNFGHNGVENFFGIGINGKNSELHAAMGLCNLPEINRLIEIRKKICNLYDELLLNNGEIIRPKLREGTEYNYAYYPVLFSSEKTLLNIVKKLNDENIFPRRYFYPSLNKLNYVKQSKMEISEDVSTRILCLPLYHTLEEKDVIRISKIILEGCVGNKMNLIKSADCL
ncbi:MAG: DegT/DnrJ/EryC1/StrS family aminotransferase [Alphaproteobacteria bacterium]